jgi:hypothetical protein
MTRDGSAPCLWVPHAALDKNRESSQHIVRLQGANRIALRLIGTSWT